MMRRLLPAIFVVLTVIIDVSVTPMITSSWLAPMMSLITVNCIGLMYGRTRGVWYALLAGLMLDIMIGWPFGLWTAVYAATGYISGLIGRAFKRTPLAPAISGLICHALYELIMLTYAYMASSGGFTSMLVLHALARTGLEAVLVTVMNVVYDLILKPSRSRFAIR